MKILFLCLLCVLGQSLYGLSDGEIREKIESYSKEYLKQNNASGLAIAVVSDRFNMDKPYHKIFCFGHSKRVDKTLIKESTLFRLGSLSKTFIAVLCALLAEEGEISWEKEAQHYLPKTFSVPKYQNLSVKLIDLLLNLSSLPNMPTVPMRSYQVSWSEVEHYFAQYKLPRAPGKKYERSDLGYALLGHIISRVKKTPYDKVLSEYLLKPLELLDTYYSVPLSKMRFLATGYKGLVEVDDRFLDRDGSFFRSTRGLVSNIQDVQKWLLFFLKMKPSSLDSCLKHIYKNCYTFPEENLKKEIPGWSIEALSSKRSLLMYYESGVYQGFSHCVAFIPDTKTGVAILANSEYAVKQLSVKILEFLVN